MNRQFAHVLLIVMLVGCVSAPQVERIPQTVVTNSDQSERESTLSNWWKALDDQALNQLMEIGLAENPSGKIALARLAQAEEGLKVARATRWPTLQGIASRDVRQISGPGVDTRSDLGVLELSWDVGLWGKRRLEIESAQEFFHERWFEHQSVHLALSALIAETYYQIVEQKMQSALLAEQLQVSLDLERLIEERFRRGQARASELYQQRESTKGLEQLNIASDTLLSVYEKSLDVLLGQVPDAESRVELDSVPVTPAMASFGAPDELIRHRPDIRASFARVRQAAAQVGIRFAERLPSLSVTASLSSLAQKTMSTVWFGHGLDLAVPIFTGGGLRGAHAQAMQVLEEERQRYLDVWLSALEEISTLQWQFEQQRAVILSVEERREFAQQALNAARNRYVLGDQNYLDVLTALRGLQEADRMLVSERLLLVTLWVQIMAAQGQRMCSESVACEQQWQL